jgi:hypothetical protein
LRLLSLWTSSDLHLRNLPRGAIEAMTFVNERCPMPSAACWAKHPQFYLFFCALCAGHPGPHSAPTNGWANWIEWPNHGDGAGVPIDVEELSR